MARWIVLAALLGLAACGPAMMRNPAPPDDSGRAEPLGRKGLRAWGDGVTTEPADDVFDWYFRSLREMAELDPAVGRDRPLDYLALSGGGQWGAFGAGILQAWTASGTRPEFHGVSGVSAGALIAPFAFLGSRYDRQLAEIYSIYATGDLVESSVLSGLLWGAALSDTTRLKAVIAKYVTPGLLAEIAAERRRGRMLLIGTTNLDAGRPVIWDLGAIADSGDPGALELARDVIRASAAIPVAFPPVLVPVVTADGRRYDEMHVDGGASSQVTFVSPGVPVGERTRQALGHDVRRRLWVIVNNDLEPAYRSLGLRVDEIAHAAVSALIRGSGAGDVYRLYAIARRDDIDFNVTWIPAQTPCPPPAEDFDRTFMRCLHGFAGELFARGALWRHTPPFYTPGLDR